MPLKEKFTYEDRPWKGPVPFLKNNDSEDLQPVLKYTARAKVFDLANDVDMGEYTEVWNSVCQGEAVCDVEERAFCKETQNFKVFMRWANVHAQASDKSKNLGIVHGLGLQRRAGS